MAIGIGSIVDPATAAMYLQLPERNQLLIQNHNPEYKPQNDGYIP